jgi:site-specific recombinase
VEEGRTPLPVLRLRHLLNQIDRQPGLREKVQGLANAFWRDVDAPSLFADFGFGLRLTLASEGLRRLRQRLLPGTPETKDLAALFALLFHPSDLAWIEALDDATLRRAAQLLAPGGAVTRAALTDAINILVSSVHATGYSPLLRQRMDPALLQAEPFRQLAASADRLRAALQEERRPKRCGKPPTCGHCWTPAAARQTA